MKKITLFSFSFLFLLLFSCNFKTEKSSTNTNNKYQTVANLEKMEFHIKGMTCEIGCARLIQSKLSKKNGVKTVKVSFKDSLGIIEFDKNLLSKKDIINEVEKIADGDLYKVTDYKTIK